MRVARCTTPSAPRTALATAEGSKRSSSSRPGITSSWPAASAKGRSARPSTPVPPLTKSRRRDCCEAAGLTPDGILPVHGRGLLPRRSVPVAADRAWRRLALPAEMTATVESGFLDRTREREVLDELLAHVRDGQSAVLVVRGEPGIGKSELLRYAAREALGFRLAQITSVEAEMELPFAAIHQLCAPLLDHLAALPQPQQDALNVALGLASGDVPNRFLVGLAVLGLLSATAEEEPLLCLVEDR